MGAQGCGTLPVHLSHPAGATHGPQEVPLGERRPTGSSCGGELAAHVGAVGGLVGVLVVDADDDGVGGFDGGVGVTEGLFDPVASIGESSGGQDLEGEAGTFGGLDGLEHARRVFGEIDFTDGDGGLAEEGFEVFGAAMAFVDACHVEVEVPAFGLDSINHVGHVGGDADKEAVVADLLEVVVDLVDLAGFEEAVGYFSVMGAGDGAGVDEPPQVGVVFALGFEGDVVHFSAFIAEAAVEFDVLPAGLPAVDSDFLAAAEGFEDLFRGVIGLHLLVDEGGKVGATVEGVGAADEPGDAMGSELNLRELRLRFFGGGGVAEGGGGDGGGSGCAEECSSVRRSWLSSGLRCFAIAH